MTVVGIIVLSIVAGWFAHSAFIVASMHALLTNEKVARKVLGKSKTNILVQAKHVIEWELERRGLES